MFRKMEGHNFLNAKDAIQALLNGFFKNFIDKSLVLWVLSFGILRV